MEIMVLSVPLIHPRTIQQIIPKLSAHWFNMQQGVVTYVSSVQNKIKQWQYFLTADQQTNMKIKIFSWGVTTILSLKTLEMN